MIDKMTVAVDNEIRKVPVLTVDQLRIFRQIEKGSDLAELVADDRTRRIVDDLLALGWVTARVDGH